MTSRLFALDGRRALVTGSSQGLGLVMARALGQAGATIILNGRDREKLDRVARDLQDEGLLVEQAAFDVTDPKAVQTAVETLGNLDIVVNNAGIHRRAPLLEMSLQDWQTVLETNLTSAFIVSRAVAPQMIERRAGKIIHVCSINSELGRRTIANYTAAKGGLKMLTKAMAVEWGPHNVQVNAIGPGYMLTPMTRTLAADPVFDEWIRGRTPLGRWGRPEDLMGAVVFLASSASDFVTGQVLYVDGGILAAV